MNKNWIIILVIIILVILGVIYLYLGSATPENVTPPTVNHSNVSGMFV